MRSRRSRAPSSEGGDTDMDPSRPADRERTRNRGQNTYQGGGASGRTRGGEWTPHVFIEIPGPCRHARYERAE